MINHADDQPGINRVCRATIPLVPCVTVGNQRQDAVLRFAPARVFALLVGMAFMLSGCLVPPILYPRTGGQGVVVDQHDKPVPYAKVEASWFPKWFPHDAWLFITPQHHALIQTKEDGSWEISVRKVNMFMNLDALPLKGYVQPESDAYYTKIPEGECRTNIVLRLIKIEDPATGEKKK